MSFHLDLAQIELVQRRAAPWTSTGAPTLQYVAVPGQNHHRAIEQMLESAREGTILVAAVPPGENLNGRVEYGWTVLHEYAGTVGDDKRWSCVVIRRCCPIRKKYRFAVPNIWQVGDTYSLFQFFAHLAKTFHDVEFYFNHDVRGIMPEAKVVSDDEMRSTAWDGVFNHNPDNSALARALRWKLHFYPYPFEVAKRMGWVPQNIVAPTKPDPFPVSEADLAWASENVPYAAGSYVVIVPLSGWWPRDWPADRSVRVAQYLDSMGVPVVMLGTKGGPLAIEGYEFKNSISLIGKTTVRQCAAVLKGAKLAVIPDTGLLHIAVGYDVPVVAPWGPSVPDKVCVGDVTPVFRKGNQKCICCYGRETFHAECDYRVDCMKSISTMQVIAAVSRKLGLPYDSKPSLSLCMMVKNEDVMLPGAIESARPLVDEIVVVDTGSTDNTRAWLESQPDITMYEFDVGDEIQSFSEVRNFAFSKATKKYVVWMDACERFKNPDRLRRIFNKQEYDCYVLPIEHGTYNYAREKIAPRIFAHFVDRVHEFMTTNGLRDGRVDPDEGVVRMPYEKKNRESVESRNIRLLRKQIEEDPRSPRILRWTYYLGKELVDAGRLDEGYPYLLKRLSFDGYLQEWFACAMLFCRLCLYEKKDFKAARETATKMIEKFPTLREGHYCLAESYYWQAHYAESRSYYEHCVKLERPNNHTMWLWEAVYTWLPQDRLSRIYEQLGDRQRAIHHAEALLSMAPPSEREWIVERIKSLSGVPTLA